MQRLGRTDLAEHILDKGGPLVHLCLPLEYDPEHPHRCELDWRTEPGELLAPERYDRASIESAVLSQLTSAARSAQYQQRPTADGGGIFSLDEFRWYRNLAELPPQGTLGVSVDGATAGRATTAAQRDAAERSRWAFTAWLCVRDSYYLLDCTALRDDIDVVLLRFERWLADLMLRVRTVPHGTRRRWTPDVCVIENKSAGPSAYALMRALNLQGLRPELEEPLGGKIERASVCLPAIRTGRVYLPERVRSDTTGDWALLRTELEEFPRGRTDDLVDSCTQMITWLQDRQSSSPPIDPKAAMRTARRLLGG
jgi:phage terminase large subunit-like protein